MKEKQFVVVMAGLLGLALLAFMLPRTAEEFPDDPLAAAARAGDIESMKGLRNRYLENGDVELARYWLLVGALEGDPELLSDYIDYFRKLSPNEQRRDVQIINAFSVAIEKREKLLRALSER